MLQKPKAQPTQAALPEGLIDFEAFVKRYERPIYHYVRSLIGDGSAEDITQDVFLKAIAALPRFRGDASLETWLFRIATNTCRDYLRRQRLKRLLFIVRTADDDSDPLSQAPATCDPIEESETRAMVRSALAQLTPHHREIVVLRDIQGFSYEEIAEIVGCPIGTVKSRLYNARSRVAEKLKAMGLERDHSKGEGR